MCNVRNAFGFSLIIVFKLDAFVLITLNVSGFIAQLVGALHRFRVVTCSNHVEVLTFSGNCLNCLNCVHNCDDHSSLDLF